MQRVRYASKRSNGSAHWCFYLVFHILSYPILSYHILQRTMWCDSVFGWGPSVPGYPHALSVCFCATVFEIPPAAFFAFFLAPTYLLKLLKHPEVKPAKSLRFVAKLIISIACFGLSLALIFLQTPNSPSSKTAQCMSAVAWILSGILLSVGYSRAKPQRWQLLFFWVSEFASSVVVFAMHTALHPSTNVHIMRGGYMICCIALAALSLCPQDQPQYADVLLSAFDEERIPIKSSLQTPLFLSETSSERRLSNRLMYGAGESEFRDVLQDWDKTLHDDNNKANAVGRVQ